MRQVSYAPAEFLHSARPRFALGAIGLMWILPFLQPYHRFPLTGFYSEWIAFAFGLAAALVLLAKRSWQETTLPVIAIAPIGLIVVLGLQVGLGRVPYPEQALTATLYLLWASLLMLLAHVLKRDLGMKAVATGLAWLLLAAGALDVLIASLQHFQVSTPLNFVIVQKSGSQGYGNIGQPNHFASYIALSLASTMYLYGRRHLRGVLAAACIASFLLVLAVAGSRSPWLYLGTLTALGLLLHHHQRDDDSRRLMKLSLWLIPGFHGARGQAAFDVRPTTVVPAGKRRRVASAALGGSVGNILERAGPGRRLGSVCVAPFSRPGAQWTRPGARRVQSRA
jgi:Protein glycosylation ligase